MFRAGWIAPLAVLAIALAVLLSDAGGAASRLRGALFDAYQRQSPAAQGSADVRVLVPDPASLKRYGPWPWPHAVLVRLTTEAKAAGASMMVFAFALDRPDPASPQNLLAELPPGPQNDAARATLSAMPSPDTDFASALRAMPSVVGITLDPAQPGAAPLIKAHFIYLGPKAPFAHAPLAHDAAPSLAELESAAAGTGALNLILDADGTLRRMPLLFRLGAAIVPSLDAEALRLSLGETTLTVKGDEGDLGAYGDRPGIAAMVSRKGDLPTAPDGSFWIAFSKSARDVAVSALDGAAPPSLGDAILFLGAPGAMVKTPLGYRDVAHIQARAMENILDASMLRRPVSALEAEAVWLLLFGLGTIFLSQRFGIFAASLLTAGGIAGAGLISWHLYLANHALFDAATPGAGLLLVFACGVGLRMRRVMRARSALRLAFADSLPRAVIDKIARRPFLLKLDGENRTITYLACGVRGFAGLAASFRNDPAAFTQLLQRVLTPLMDQVLAHGGTIDRLTADGFTAFWNAPLDDADHAIHACEAANGISITASKINEFITQERRLDGMALAPVEVGIGIATGSVIAGGLRSHGRTGYAVNGDAVALANRIQALSPQYGPAVIVGEATRAAAERSFAFLEVDYIAAGARDEPVKLYALLGNPVIRASPKFRALMTFHDHIFHALRTRQWGKARELIEQARKLSGASQKLYDLHLTRIAYFEANPPGEDWDGAFRPILK